MSSRPPDALAPPPGNPRFPLLDPLRAVAALCIVVTHTAGLGGFNQAHALGAWTARLDCGVAIFFVLSGFLLYRPFVPARLDGRPGPRVGRRALRILPAYWVALILLGLIVPQYTPGVFGHDWWVYFGLLQSWSANTILGGISATWSLSVELAFYILLPFYALALRRASVRTELIVLGVSAVAAVVVRTLVGSEGVYRNTLPGMWAWFAGGLALAVLSAHVGTRRVGPPALVWWGGAFALLTVAAWAVGLPRALGDPYTNATLQWEHVLYLGVAICVVAPGVFRPITPWRWLAWLGLVSYGIFLYHQAFVNAFVDVRTKVPFAGWAFYTLLVALCAIGCAALSYYIVERPLLRLKEPQRAGGTGGSSARARARAVAAKSES